MSLLLLQPSSDMIATFCMCTIPASLESIVVFPSTQTGVRTALLKLISANFSAD